MVSLVATDACTAIAAADIYDAAIDGEGTHILGTDTRQELVAAIDG